MYVSMYDNVLIAYIQYIHIYISTDVDTIYPNFGIKGFCISECRIGSGMYARLRVVIKHRHKVSPFFCAVFVHGGFL